jgi:hypothetical protein
MPDPNLTEAVAELRRLLPTPPPEQEPSDET